MEETGDLGEVGAEEADGGGVRGPGLGEEESEEFKTSHVEGNVYS